MTQKHTMHVKIFHISEFEQKTEQYYSQRYYLNYFYTVYFSKQHETLSVESKIFFFLNFFRNDIVIKIEMNYYKIENKK